MASVVKGLDRQYEPTPVYEPFVADLIVIHTAGVAGGETCVPTVSEWGAIGMTLLLLVAGTIVFVRKRRVETDLA